LTTSISNPRQYRVYLDGQLVVETRDLAQVHAYYDKAQATGQSIRITSTREPRPMPSREEYHRALRDLRAAAFHAAELAIRTGRDTIQTAEHQKAINVAEWLHDREKGADE
jgi:hypothetical protein